MGRSAFTSYFPPAWLTQFTIIDSVRLKFFAFCLGVLNGLPISFESFKGSTSAGINFAFGTAEISSSLNFQYSLTIIALFVIFNALSAASVDLVLSISSQLLGYGVLSIFWVNYMAFKSLYPTNSFTDVTECTTFGVAGEIVAVALLSISIYRYYKDPEPDCEAIAGFAIPYERIPETPTSEQDGL